MNDQPTNPPEEETASSEPHGPLGGERLAEARRELKISVLEIAKELHLDEPKVRALERNDFDFLGAPVFAKGHLRKYAQLVNANADDVLEDYYKLTRATSLPPVVAAREKPRQELSPGPWIAVVVIAVIAATAYWVLTEWPAGSSASAPASVLPAAERAEDDAATEPAEDDAADTTRGEPATVTDTATPTSGQPAAENPVAAEPVPEPQPEPEPAPVPEVAEGQLHMLVTYSGDCWTEISDASGRRLFFALGKDGRTVELSGEAPFNALFGDADNVSLRVNGAAFEIPAAARRGRTARLTIAGD